MNDTNTCASDSPAWTDWRKTILGGSDIAAIIGLSPYQTAFDVWAVKSGAIVTQKSAAMSWGNRLERLILEAYTEETGIVVTPNNKSFRHSVHAWAGYTPDGFISPTKLFEAKTAGLRQSHRWGEPFTDDIPEEYLAQIQYYLGLSGAESCAVAVLIGGQSLQIYEVVFNQTFFDKLIEAGRAFWLNHVLTGIAPPIGGAHKAQEYLRALYPNSDHPPRSATAEEFEPMLRLEWLKDQIEPLDAEQDSVKNELRLSIGASEKISYDGYTASYKQNKASEKTDYEAAFNKLLEMTNALDLKDEILKVCTTSKEGARVLRLTFPKLKNS